MKKLSDLILLEKKYLEQKNDIVTKFEAKTQKYLHKVQKKIQTLQDEISNKDNLIQSKISELSETETQAKSNHPQQAPELNKKNIQESILRQLQ